MAFVKAFAPLFDVELFLSTFLNRLFSILENLYYGDILQMFYFRNTLSRISFNPLGRACPAYLSSSLGILSIPAALQFFICVKTLIRKHLYNHHNVMNSI